MKTLSIHAACESSRCQTVAIQLRDILMTLFLSRVFAVTLALFYITTCSGAESYDIEDYAGLYEIVAKECHVPAGSFDPCENTLFFEIVKGKFRGLGRSQIGYVFWSGNPKLNADLQYESHRLSVAPSGTLDGEKLWLNRGDGGAREYLMISNGIPIRYVARFAATKGGNTRTIEYSLKPVRREDLPVIRLNYPAAE